MAPSRTTSKPCPSSACAYNSAIRRLSAKSKLATRTPADSETPGSSASVPEQLAPIVAANTAASSHVFLTIPVSRNRRIDAL
jgi:hypothetical protein